jgi:hypothetical protein
LVSIDIDEELGRQGATFVMADGTRGDLPADFVLYYCDPTYDWSPINQLKRVLRDKLEASKLSVRVLADALGTSPSQVVRLLEENRGSKQLLQLLKLAELAGYRALHAEAEAGGVDRGSDGRNPASSAKSAFLRTVGLVP